MKNTLRIVLIVIGSILFGVSTLRFDLALMLMVILLFENSRFRQIEKLINKENY